MKILGLIGLSAVAAFAAVLAPTSAFAQRLVYPMQLTRCGDASVASEVAIASCTYVIRARNATEVERATAFNNRGLRYISAHDQTRAIDDFSHAVRTLPTSVEGYVNRATVYLAIREYARAVVDYSEVISIAPDKAVGYNGRCWTRVLWNAALDLARRDCDAAVALDPDYGAARGSRGLLNMRESRFQEAYDDFNAALASTPDHASYLYGRGVAALRLGHEQEGRADLARAAQMDAHVAETYQEYGIAL